MVERQSIMEKAYQLAQTKVNTLKHKKQQFHQQLANAIQYGMLGISRQGLETVLNKQQDTAKHSLDLDKLLDMATSEKYAVLAEKQTEDQTRQLKALIQDAHLTDNPPEPQTAVAQGGTR